jgi:hypothetical protein
VTTREQDENIRVWVAALRSGEYKQGRGTLFNPNEFGADAGHCCLGVAGRVVCHIDDVTLAEGGGYGQVMDAVGLSSTLGFFSDKDGRRLSLALLNDFNDDRRLNFNQIADLIESRPKGLFI